MRRLVRGNAIPALLLIIIMLISTLGAAELYTISTSQTLFVNGSPTQYFTITGYPSSTTAGQSFSGLTVTVYNLMAKWQLALRVQSISLQPIPRLLCLILLRASTPLQQVARAIRASIPFQVSFLQPLALKL